MKKSSSSGHFWPAYVDLMTVLLMVFMLLTLLFQMVASIARMQEGIQISHAETMQIVPENFSDVLKLRFEKEGVLLEDSDRAAIRSWLSSNASSIAQSGYSISASTPAERADTGGGLSVQFSRILEIKRIAAELGVSEDKLKIKNQVDADSTESASTIWLHQEAS